MRGFITIVSVILCLLLIVEVKLQSVVAESAPPPEAVEDEPTCSLDPSEQGDCSTYDTVRSDYNVDGSAISTQDDLTRQVISLTDENFNELTLTSTPATWLIMFKTDACGICKKAKPVLEELSIDENISNHNDREMEAIIHDGSDKKQQSNEQQSQEEDTEGGVVPKGPIYIATIDASWSGRDVSKRFNVDATPTIIVIRNEGYDGIKSKVDSRSYYIYRGQRATYPLRMFVLGGYTHRKRLDMPPPILDEERKPQTYWGRIKEYIFSPAAKWMGSLIGKFLLAWFVFIGGLGLFMRIHNYAWGENADDHDARHEERQKEIEKEKAQGRKEYEQTNADERSARRQKIIWDQKAKNHAKFAANREARKKKTDNNKLYDEDDEFDGVGFSVKKADTLKNSNTKEMGLGKSKDN